MVWQLPLSKHPLYVFSPRLVFYNREHVLFNLDLFQQPFTQLVTIFVSSKVPFAKLWYEYSWSELEKYKKFFEYTFRKCRHSRSQVFIKIGSYLCWSLLIEKSQAWRSATLLEKKLKHRCFPVNIAKFLWSAFLRNTCGVYFWKWLKNFWEFLI